MKPLPISTAPDEIVVLTDLGPAQKHNDTWFLCETDASWLYNCYDELMRVKPTLWVPLPDWMKP